MSTRSCVAFDYTYLLSPPLPDDHAVTADELDALSGRVGDACQAVAQARRDGRLPFMDLPYQDGAVGCVERLASELHPRFDNVVVLGIGGSALGNIALHTALNHPFHNLLDRQRRGGFPRVFVEDNIDPDHLSGLLDALDLTRTLFNVITKSGSTAETMSQFLIVQDILRTRLGDRAKDHMVATTDPANGPLHEIACHEGLTTLDVPPGVGGRFSVLSSVGLFSAAMSGIDIRRVLAGAAAMDRRCQQDDWRVNPAALGAALLYTLDTAKDKHIHVMMPYSSALGRLADWFRQLWAESLGKVRTENGRTVHVGPTPVKALGATDQHSQIQLYRHGPNDKVVVLVGVGQFSHDVPIPALYADQSAVGYLGGRSMQELLHAEQKATALALTASHRPNATIQVPAVTPEAMGELFYMLEVMTALAGELYGINAFDQPGVEDGKLAARALMGAPGDVHDDERERIRLLEADAPKRVLEP